MSFKKNENGISEGAFIPETDHDKKLYLAN
jgi:hypothetical protein